MGHIGYPCAADVITLKDLERFFPELVKKFREALDGSGYTFEEMAATYYGETDLPRPFGLFTALRDLQDAFAGVTKAGISPLYMMEGSSYDALEYDIDPESFVIFNHKELIPSVLQFGKYIATVKWIEY